jgi:hypothetical protein
MSILEKIQKPVALITVMENIMPRYNFIILEDPLPIAYTNLSNRKIYPFIGVCKKKIR